MSLQGRIGAYIASHLNDRLGGRGFESRPLRHLFESHRQRWLFLCKAPRGAAYSRVGHSLFAQSRGRFARKARPFSHSKIVYPTSALVGFGDRHVDYAPCGFLAGQCMSHACISACQLPTREGADAPRTRPCWLLIQAQGTSLLCPIHGQRGHRQQAPDAQTDGLLAARQALDDVGRQESQIDRAGHIPTRLAMLFRERQDAVTLTRAQGRKPPIGAGQQCHQPSIWRLGLGTLIANHQSHRMVAVSELHGHGDASERVTHPLTAVVRSPATRKSISSADRPTTTRATSALIVLMRSAACPVDSTAARFAADSNSALVSAALSDGTAASRPCSSRRNPISSLSTARSSSSAGMRIAAWASSL